MNTSNWPHKQDLGHSNHTGRFARRSDMDTYHSADDRLTVSRLLGGLMFAGTFVLAYVVLAAWF